MLEQLPKEFHEGWNLVTARKKRLSFNPIVNGNELKENLYEAFSQSINFTKPTNILVDLGDIPEIDDIGVFVLVSALQLTGRNGGEVVLTRVHEEMRGYLALNGLVKTGDNPVGFRIVEPVGGRRE